MKKIIALALVAILLFGFSANAALAADRTPIAEELNQLGLLQGTEKGYSLERAPTRAEALTMLIRLLGVEKDALAGTWETPFTDVPTWAEPYVGYAYTNGITKGTTETTFGASSVCSAQMYTTYVLRALGYSDSAGGDFEYSSAVEFAQSAGLISSGSANAEQFNRAELVEVSYNALFANSKGSDTILLQDLVIKGAVSADSAASIFAQLELQQELIEVLSAANAQDISYSGNISVKSAGVVSAEATFAVKVQDENLTAALQGNFSGDNYKFYVKDGHVYLDVAKIPGYIEVPMTGKLNLEKLVAILPTDELDTDTAVTPADYAGISITKTSDESGVSYTIGLGDLLSIYQDEIYEDVSGLSGSVTIKIGTDGLIEGLSGKLEYVNSDNSVDSVLFEATYTAGLTIEIPSAVDGYGDLTDLFIQAVAELLQ